MVSEYGKRLVGGLQRASLDARVASVVTAVSGARARGNMASGTRAISDPARVLQHTT